MNYTSPNSSLSFSIITSKGASNPVQRVKFLAPWHASMPRPLTVCAPYPEASCKNRVFDGLNTTSLTVMFGVMVSYRMSGLFPLSSPSPMHVALIRISVPSGISSCGVHSSVSANTSVLARIRSASSRALAAVRLTTVIFAAPARAHSTAMARAAPPAPRITIFFPSGHPHDNSIHRTDNGSSL